MISINGKKVERVSINGKNVAVLYTATRKIWEAAVACFSGRLWNGKKRWVGKEKWNGGRKRIKTI